MEAQQSCVSHTKFLFLVSFAFIFCLRYFISRKDTSSLSQCYTFFPLGCYFCNPNPMFSLSPAMYKCSAQKWIAVAASTGSTETVPILLKAFVPFQICVSRMDHMKDEHKGTTAYNMDVVTFQPSRFLAGVH